ncbi:radical SAM protein [candidate division KSB1 bacterium]|nr:radical SAM protein [candidate division KSB1 bacterium]MBL7092429.1 radical SAM protein [candidate division KSB1 bacterium]
MPMKKTQENKFFSFSKNILNNEKNSVKQQREGLLSIALVFPNSYAVGMSNLGFQTVYKLFNEFPGVSCERAFYYPYFPTVTKTLESNRELREFDVIAFSVSFEMDFINIIQILINGGITPLSSNRDFREPLIIAGGAVTFLNPAPLTPFVDIFLIGELEPKLHTLMESLLNSKKQNLSKNEILESFNASPGFYVPAKFENHQKVQKVHFHLKNENPQYSPILSPDSHFKNMFLTEVGRGCGRKCNFCAASFIYQPFRIFPVERILETIRTHCQETKRIGLIGSAISDYPKIKTLCLQLVKKNYQLGLSSFRLDKIDDSFINILERGKVNSIAFAPEAGTERLRKTINKNLSQEQIIDAAEVISHSSVNQVKLYFLIGLPGETWEDIEGIVTLVDKMQQIFYRSKRTKKMTISVNTFIPKPFTPFQWAAMEKISEIQRKRKHLNKKLKALTGVQISPKSAKEEILQGIFSLGGKDIGKAIYFKIIDNLDWEQAWLKAGVNEQKILFSEKQSGEVFPWDFNEA